jgi:hypothetical protein
MPDVVPTVIAATPCGSSIGIETIAEAAVSKKKRRMTNLIKLW